jgi:hypothetical protein
MNEFRGERVIDFGAEVADVDVDDVGEIFEAFVPDMLNNHSAGKGLADVGDHVFEERVFLGGEFDASTRANDPLSEAIDFEVSHAEDVGAFGGGAAQEGLDADQELGQGEGFGEVVIGPGIKQFYFISGAIAGGEDEDGGVLGISAESAEQVGAVEAWEHEVEDDEVVV